MLKDGWPTSRKQITNCQQLLARILFKHRLLPTAVYLLSRIKKWCLLVAKFVPMLICARRCLLAAAPC